MRLHAARTVMILGWAIVPLAGPVRAGDSGSGTIPYNDFPIRPGIESGVPSITTSTATSVGLRCCCPPEVSPSVREPEYPPEAKQSGVKGWVTVSGSVLPDGRIQGAKVTNASPKGVFD